MSFAGISGWKCVWCSSGRCTAGKHSNRNVEVLQEGSTGKYSMFLSYLLMKRADKEYLVVWLDCSRIEIPLKEKWGRFTCLERPGGRLDRVLTWSIVHISTVPRFMTDCSIRKYEDEFGSTKEKIMSTGPLNDLHRAIWWKYVIEISKFELLSETEYCLFGGR